MRVFTPLFKNGGMTVNNEQLKNKYILELNHVSKEFPGVRALDDVSFKVRTGTVHGIIGENGAGKSTLMKILIGVHAPTSGEVLFDGSAIKYHHPADALHAGIAMVHQELMPIRELTVAQSIFIGKEPIVKGIGLIRDNLIVEKSRELFERLNIQIDPRKRIGDLTTAQMQMVEIAKAVSYDAKLIIMDEPTSSLTENEVEKLFDIINTLRSNGVTILYISHKMAEITEITDEVSVLRDGKFIQTLVTAQSDIETMIGLMVGHDVENLYPKYDVTPGEVLLEVKGLTRAGAFENVSFQIRAGEIVGFSGLVGAGRSEVMRAIFGLDPIDAGEIYINGKKLDIRSPRDAIRHKLIMLTEERKKDGLFLSHSVLHNMILANIDSYWNGFVLNSKKMRGDCAEQIKLLSTKTPSQDQEVGNLSGGNQQKVLISRWLLTQPRILIMDEPTRGIDVGAKAEIHRLMSELAQQGCAVIMISSELPEILGMSDRILVMHEGRITGEVARADATQENVTRLAFGFTD